MRVTLFSISNTEPLELKATPIMTNFKLIEHSWYSPTCHWHCQHNIEPLDSETTPIMTNFKLLEHTWYSPTCHGHCQHNIFVSNKKKRRGFFNPITISKDTYCHESYCLKKWQYIYEPSK